jgi:hypothetical protein
VGALDCRSSLKGVNFMDTSSGFRRHLQAASLPSYINFAYSPILLVFCQMRQSWIYNTNP